MRADSHQRVSLLQEHPELVGIELAYAVKELGYAAWDHDPTLTEEASLVLAVLAERLPHPEVAALAAWMKGIAALASGQLEEALTALDAAVQQFRQLAKPLMAARVQVGQLVALGLLGRYEEALTCGLAARDVLLQYYDETTAGRVELNLGHLAFRRDRYDEAEIYYRLAYHRFSRTDDPALLAGVENALADVLVRKQAFTAAQALYEQALQRAIQAKLGVIQALTECNLGNLALAQGRYDQALEYLEQSRRHYAALDLPHESAYADLELAEAYLELNLAAEASAILHRVTPIFAQLGMRSEEAWALAHQGQAALLLGDTVTARQHFQAARRLFEAEDNAVATALVALFEAKLLYSTQQFAAAAMMAADAEAVFRAAQDHLRRLFAAWLRGEALRAAGNADEAEAVLCVTLHEAEASALPQVVQRCATGLGLLAVGRGDLTTAESLLGRAMQLVEEMRAPLPAEEFRMAFVTDKLTPFQAMVRICLDSGREAEALGYVERARARALVELLGSAAVRLIHPRDEFEQAAVQRLSELRQQLNWCYQQLGRLPTGDDHSSIHLGTLQTFIQQYETAILDLTRQLQQSGSLPVTGPAFDLKLLQQLLGHDTALVAYYSVGDELVAFVVGNEQVRSVRCLASMAEVEAIVDRLRFQLDAMRRAVGHTSAHADLLLQRVRHYLARLYDAVLRPLEPLIDTYQRLVMVPHGVLHYAPLPALFDGNQYVLERFEICAAPAAAVVQHYAQHSVRDGGCGVFVGVPDANAPRVRDEVEAIANLWPNHVTLVGDAATIAVVQHYAAQARVLHLACHGTFRPDNPLFSGLQLADGRLTVLDIYQLRLSCELVVLSACETGLNLVAPGDEVIGLTRGFLTAGSPSVIVSLWTVDDETTARLMTTFYTLLRMGLRPAAALRYAQQSIMQSHPHPFFWAPFILIGRW
ncbi:MAG: CHAT domain-containing protein [Chloroflexus sp.]